MRVPLLESVVGRCETIGCSASGSIDSASMTGAEAGRTERLEQRDPRATGTRAEVENTGRARGFKPRADNRQRSRVDTPDILRPRENFAKQHLEPVGHPVEQVVDLVEAPGAWTLAICAGQQIVLKRQRPKESAALRYQGNTAHEALVRS